MSLDWRWAEDREPEEYGWVDVETPGGTRRDVSPYTQAVVFTTMFVGIRVLDDSTIEEFISRTLAWEEATGAFLSRHDENGVHPVPLTREVIEGHKGLITNASPMGKREFAKALTRARDGIERDRVAAAARKGSQAARAAQPVKADR